MEPILITASVFATIYGIVYLSIRRKERMALLDRGLDPKSFEYGSTGANILVSIGAMDREAAYFSLVSLFGGIALIVDYLLEISITKRRIKEKASENQMNSNS